MPCISASMLTDFYPLGVVTSVSKSHCRIPYIDISKMSPSHHHRNLVHRVSCLQSTVVNMEDEEKDEQRQRIKWVDIGPNITESQKQAISELSPKMTKRCKALMKHIICSHQDGSLPLLLAAWVKVMKPKRADWLSILKEMKRLDNPMLLEVMEYALVEESFEADVRDYTKIIDAYAKQNRLPDAENAFLTMKRRGFICDQVTLTVLIHMYSKAGDLQRAKETFEEIKLLGLPVDKRAYGSMIMAYIRAGMPDLGEILLVEMDSREVFACKEVYKALLRAYSATGNADGAQRVFGYIQLARIVPDVKMCALLVNAYYVAGQSEKAHSVVENMKSAGLKPNDKCIALMLASYEKEKKLEKALGLLMDLERENVVIGKEASEVLARWFGKLGVVNEVEHVLTEFAEKQVKCIGF